MLINLNLASVQRRWLILHNDFRVGAVILCCKAKRAKCVFVLALVGQAFYHPKYFFVQNADNFARDNQSVVSMIILRIIHRMERAFSLQFYSYFKFQLTTYRQVVLTRASPHMRGCAAAGEQPRCSWLVTQRRSTNVRGCTVDQLPLRSRKKARPCSQAPASESHQDACVVRVSISNLQQVRQ